MQGNNSPAPNKPYPPVRNRAGGFRKNRNSWKIWIVIVTIILVVCSAFLGFFTSIILSKFTAFELLFSLAPSGIQIPEMNILVLGVDATKVLRRSDTIIVVHIDPEKKSVGVVSIPRDTLVVIPGVRIDKINHAYAFGGPELACATTSSFLNVPVSNYIKINLDKLGKIIDRLGGMTIDVKERMYYVDYAGGLYINLKPGLQTLNGEQALGYLRFRHDALGDIGRIRRQQKFLEEVATKVAKTKDFVQIYQLILDFIDSVETNLTPSQIFSLASIVRQTYETGNISATSIPGSSIRIDNIYYLQPDMDQVAKITDQLLKGKKINEISQRKTQQ